MSKPVCFDLKLTFKVSSGFNKQLGSVVFLKEMNMTLYEMITKMEFFKNFSEDGKKRVCQIENSLVELKKGDMIIKEGKESKSIYLLLEGSALITNVFLVIRNLISSILYIDIIPVIIPLDEIRYFHHPSLTKLYPFFPNLHIEMIIFNKKLSGS